MSPSWMAQLGAGQRTTVAAHEIGHALGLPHNGMNSIMQPNLQNMAAGPTALDIRNLQALYPGGSGKAGSGAVENPFDGLVDALVGKLKAAFPGGGMFLDAAGGFAKEGISQVIKMVSDIKAGISRIARDVFGSIKNFFGGGAATAPTLYDNGGVLAPNGGRPQLVQNKTGKPEFVHPDRQLADREAHMRASGGEPLTFTAQLDGSPMRLLSRSKYIRSGLRRWLVWVGWCSPKLCSTSERDEYSYASCSQLKLGGTVADDYRMTSDDMPEETRRPFPDSDLPDAAKQYLSLDPQGPEVAAITFVQNLIDWDELEERLGIEALMEDMLLRVTPESRRSWGGFGGLVDMLASIANPARGMSVHEAEGDPDVVYYPVFDSAEGFVRKQGDISETPFIVTLVNRPKAGGWKVHAAGGGYKHPELVPRDL